MPTVWPVWVGQDYYQPTGTTNGTWNVWVTTSRTAGTIYPQTAGTAGTIWPAWINQPLSTGTDLINQTVWVDWQTAGTGSVHYQPGPVVVAPAPPLTPEQQAERDAQRERFRREQARTSLIYRNRDRAWKLRRKPAERRAEALLMEHLTDAQREEWKAERAFTVHTADGKRAYKIAYGLAGNVRLIAAEEPPIGKAGYPLRVGARFCMHVYHPDGWVPNEDNVLAQKLLIESNERHFLELANAS